MRYPNTKLLASLFVLTLAASPASRAGEVRFDGVLPNGAPYMRHVESMQEGRYRNMVRQHTDYSCGAAALATVLRYAYHLNVDETTVIQGMMGVADCGGCGGAGDCSGLAGGCDAGDCGAWPISMVCCCSIFGCIIHSLCVHTHMCLSIAACLGLIYSISKEERSRLVLNSSSFFFCRAGL